MARKIEGRVIVGALAGTGGTPNTDGCDDADVPVAGCGGEGGDRPLATDARLRTACNVSTNVNRRGQPIPISMPTVTGSASNPLGST